MKNIIFFLLLLVGNCFLPTVGVAQMPTQEQLESIEKLLAPQRQKVLSILEADKTGQYNRYKAEVEAITKESNPARQDELISRLEANHLAFIRKAYADAKINHVQLKQGVAKVLGKIQFKFGEFADIQIEFIPPNLALPERFDVTLNCPFDVQDESDNGAAASQCDAESFDCTIRVESLSEIAGGCRSKGDVGGKFDLPEGNFTNVTVQAQSDISYRGFVGSLGGYGQINAKFGIRFRAANGTDKTVMAKEVLGLAPVVWLNILRGEASNFSSQASFSGSFPGGTSVTAQVHTEVFAMSAVLSLAEMDANTDNIDFIRIKGSN